MIERYSRKEIKKIWEEKNKYRIWLDIEIAAAQAMEKYKIIPKGVSSKVRKKAKINVDRIHKIENKVHHDVIAFHMWKNLTKGRFLWLRNNASTLVSQAIDTVLFVIIAFIGVYAWHELWGMIWVTYLIKMCLAIADTPLLYGLVYLARRNNLRIEEI